METTTTEMIQAGSIYQDLLTAAKMEDATFAERLPTETDAQYLERLVVKVGQVSQGTWDKLSESTQEWFNKAADMVNAVTPITDCPGYQFTPVPAPEAATAPAAEPVTVTSPAEQQGSAPADAPAAPAPAAPTEATAPAAPAKARGIMMRIREIALVNPKWGDAQITEELVKQGWAADAIKPDTVWMCRTESKNVLRAAENIGYKFVKAE